MTEAISPVTSARMSINKVVIFGGTGAQAGPIVRGKGGYLKIIWTIITDMHPRTALSNTNKFQVTVPTRNVNSPAAQALKELSNTTLLEATYTTEEGLRASFAGQDACYFIINSFDIREPDEYFWTIRAYEIAAQSGLKLFVYSGAQNRLKDAGYDEKYRNSHNMVKGHACDWLKNQRADVLPWTVLYGYVWSFSTPVFDLQGPLLTSLPVIRGVYAEMLGCVYPQVKYHPF